jgi:hypothetical protein
MPPTAQPPTIGDRSQAHAGEAGAAVLAVLRLHLLLFVAEHEHVVQHRARLRAHFDRGEPAVLGQAERDREVAVDVAAGGGHFEGALGAHHEVRFAELPPFGELRQRRQPVGRALRACRS